MHPLPDGRDLLIVRYFADVTDDPLEGRRERVILVDCTGKRLPLMENCTGAGNIAAYSKQVAFHCVQEQAGDHLLHRVVVFNTDGKQLIAVPRCRNPKWSSEHAMVCQKELVNPDGQLELQDKLVAIP